MNSPEKDRRKRMNRNAILFQDVSPKDILPHLTCLTASEKEHIECQANSQGDRRAAYLLSLALVKYDGWFECLIPALRELGWNKLADLLDDPVDKHQADHPRDRPCDSHNPEGHLDARPGDRLHKKGQLKDLLDDPVDNHPADYPRDRPCDSSHGDNPEGHSDARPGNCLPKKGDTPVAPVPQLYKQKSKEARSTSLMTASTTRSPGSKATMKTRFGQLRSSIFPIVRRLDVLSHVGNDWMGLAGQLGFDVDFVQRLKSLAGSPTEALLSEWGKDPNATLGELIESLQAIGRKDVCQELKEALGLHSEAEADNMDNNTETLDQMSSVSPTSATPKDDNDTAKVGFNKHKESCSATGTEQCMMAPRVENSSNKAGSEESTYEDDKKPLKELRSYKAEKFNISSENQNTADGKSQKNLQCQDSGDPDTNQDNSPLPVNNLNKVADPETDDQNFTGSLEHDTTSCGKTLLSKDIENPSDHCWNPESFSPEDIKGPLLSRSMPIELLLSDKSTSTARSEDSNGCTASTMPSTSQSSASNAATSASATCESSLSTVPTSIATQNSKFMPITQATPSSATCVMTTATSPSSADQSANNKAARPVQVQMSSQGTPVQHPIGASSCLPDACQAPSIDGTFTKDALIAAPASQTHHKATSLSCQTSSEVLQGLVSPIKSVQVTESQSAVCQQNTLQPSPGAQNEEESTDNFYHLSDRNREASVKPHALDDAAFLNSHQLETCTQGYPCSTQSQSAVDQANTQPPPSAQTGDEPPKDPQEPGDVDENVQGDAGGAAAEPQGRGALVGALALAVPVILSLASALRGGDLVSNAF